MSGGPGLFSVDIKANGNSATEKVGAVVQATGWVPYDANKLGHLGYGKFKDVVTNVEMEEMAAAGEDHPALGWGRCQKRPFYPVCRLQGT